MNESRSSLYPLLTGLAGGAVAWAGIELLLAYSGLFPDMRALNLTLGGLAGLLLGSIAPMAEGLRQAQRRKTLSALFVGAVFGTIAGALGMGAGQWILSIAADRASISGTGLAGYGASLARIPGWILMGVAIGAASGIRSRSTRRIMAGALGGLIGGLLGGIVAEILANLVGRFYGRGVGVVLWGVAVAFLADRMEARRAIGRLTVLSGSLKGRSFPVNQGKFNIGRSASADLTVPGSPDDSGVPGLPAAASAATLVMKKGTIILEPGESSPVELNGEMKQSTDGTVLRYDDVIKVDGVTMIYEARR